MVKSHRLWSQSWMRMTTLQCFRVVSMIVALFPGSGEEPGNEVSVHVFLQLIVATMTNLI